MIRVGNKKDKPKYSVLSNTKYILGNLWKWNKKYFMLGFIKIPMSVLSPFLPILMSKLVIDAVIEQRPPKDMVYYIIGITALMIVMKWIEERTQSVIGWNAKGYRFKYISMINRKRMTTDYENLISAEGQHLLNRALQATSHDGAASQRSLGILIDLMADLLGFVLYGTLIAYLNIWMIIVLLITSLLSFWRMEYVRLYNFNQRKACTPVDTKLSYIINRSGDLSNAKDIRLYNMSDWFKEMFNLFSKQRFELHKQLRIKLFVSALIDAGLILLRDGLAYVVLIYMLVQGNLEIGNFVLYFGAIGGFSDWLIGIINKINQYNAISLDICDLRAFLDMKEKINRKGETPPTNTTYELTLQDVCYRYESSEKEVLKNINLTIKKGEKLALVGVNGAGKTTLVSILCGLLTPTSGKVLLNGIDIRMYNTKDYFDLFSAVFQNIRFLPLSIEENIALSSECVDIKRVMTCLKLAGLEDDVKHLPDGVKTRLIKNINQDAIELSGGQQQKLALARAIYKDAPFLVLDEPTSALDPIAENEIYLKYHSLTKDKTSIFISHRLSSTRFCDRIAFLDKGEITEIGSHEALMEKNGGYANMFEIQSHYYKKQLVEGRCF